MRMRFSVIILLLQVCAWQVQAQTASAKWRVIEVEADTLLNRQDFEGALKLYDKVVSQSRLTSKEAKGVLYKRAICYYSLGDFQKALRDINIFIPEYESFPQARLLRAFIHRELGNTEAQLEDIETLLTFNPMNADFLKWKTGIYLDTEKFEEAKKELISLQQFINDEEIETQLGFAYYSLEKPDSAFIHFDKALSINGGYLPAYLYISSLCLDQQAYELALTYIDLALRLDPANANLFFYKGISMIELKNTEEGCRLLSKAFYAGLDQAGDYLKQHCYGADR
jgi:tetratricopeptide (TPR) repeat protein